MTSEKKKSHQKKREAYSNKQNNTAHSPPIKIKFTLDDNEEPYIVPENEMHLTVLEAVNLEKQRRGLPPSSDIYLIQPWKGQKPKDGEVIMSKKQLKQLL